jgi:hypothetical protein
MSFASPINAVFESLICDNLAAVFKRDLKAALDLFYSSDNLPDLAQLSLGRFITLDFPLLAVEVQKNDDNQGEEYTSRTITILMMFATTDANGATLIRKTQKYVRAIYAVIERAGVADLTAGAGSNQIMPIVKSLSWQYDEIGKDAEAGLYTQPVNFRLTLKFSER